MDTRLLYLGLIGLVALERLLELVVSRRHKRRLRGRGGRVVGRGHYRVMVLLHASLLAAAPLEVWLLERPFQAPLAISMTALVTAAMALRYWVIATLGERWTTEVVVVPGAAPVDGGPYRLLRHPNYLAVVVEVAALPLVHGAWLTAAAWSLMNAFILAVRIRVEEEALETAGGYRERLGGRPRLVPGLGRRP